MNRLFLFTVGVRSCYKCFQAVKVGVRSCMQRLFLLTVGVLSCYHCFQVVYEQIILFDSWCTFMLSLFRSLFILKLVYMYVHVINVFQVVYEHVIRLER